LLTGVQLGIWVRRGVDEKCDLPLVKRLQTAMENPAQISRFGGLSLGESTHLIDEVGPLTEEIGKGQLLLAVGDGDLSLPIWPDHVGSKTRWGQYRLVRFALDSDLPTGAWTAIKRPA
jgi:CRISPR-associated protein Cas5t